MAKSPLCMWQHYKIEKKIHTHKLIYGRCEKSGNHLEEDLAKSGYKPNMKSKFFNCPSIF